MNCRMIETIFNQGIFMKERNEELQEEVGSMNLVNIYPDINYQTISGFGGAFTEAAAYNLYNMSQDKRKEIIDAYFGEVGIGYTLGRTHINSCDFALDNYAYVTDESDKELTSFSIERDRKYIIPFIKEAINTSKDEIRFLASPWSPPSFMKTNNEMNNGGRLKKDYQQMWAKYIAKYIKEYEKEGIKITRITVQNEPEAVQTWDSCQYSAIEEMSFVRDYLGPVLEQEALSHVGIFVWDHNKEILFERAREILSDEKANQYIKGIGFHWYTGDHFEAVGLVREKYKDKELFFTEGCVEYSRFGESNEVEKAEMYAHDILGNLNAGMNGYLDWNMVLDDKGGPNHVGNYCAAPILCNTIDDTYEKSLSYYYIGHFSRYILPGAKRIATTKYTDSFEVTAFVNLDGERVVVLLNKQDKQAEVVIREYNLGKSIVVKPHSILTICYK